MAAEEELPTPAEWEELLRKSRAASRKALQQDGGRADDSLLAIFRKNCAAVKQQMLHQYASSMIDDEMKYERKKTILGTRKALRFALSCLSIRAPPSENNSDDGEPVEEHHTNTAAQRRLNDWGTTIQLEAYASWSHALLLNISLKKAAADGKCQLLAAQVLSNLITENPQTACQLIKTLPLAPSDDVIASKILFQKLDNTKEDQEPATAEQQQQQQLSWVDLLLSCAPNNRPALAAITACLHNCLAAIGANEELQFATAVASSPLLIPTLLRHIVPAATVAMQQADNNLKSSSTDDVTEWILLIIDRLCRHTGLLPLLYESIGNKSTVPEHVILLYIVLHNIEKEESKNTPFCCCRVLGNSEENVAKTHLFLARLFLQSFKETSSLSDDKLIDDDDNGHLRQSVQQLVLDILAETLAQDSSDTASIRCSIGRETVLIRQLVQGLGGILDAWLVVNEGKKAARDHMAMSEIDQRYITSIVRVLGNLCYQCRHNQDLLRMTILAAPQKSQSTGRETEQERNGLHVLLSSTSLSHSCFTLREWAIVAIRNALDGNEANQVVVAELESQHALQSTELQDMGIRVDLNAGKGRVSITPLDEMARRKSEDE